MLTPEQQKELIEKVFHEGLDLGGLSAADRYLTADFRNHGSHDDSMRGPEAFKHTTKIQQSAFSDIKYETLDFISQGDKAASRTTAAGSPRPPPSARTAPTASPARGPEPSRPPG
ncbi:ester cyclase [Streptomyces sp. TE5632]